MSEEKIPYGEIICEAVDTIVSKRIQSLDYDITINGIITDDTYKAQGKYTVSSNSVKFDAYSTITTLEVGDSVLVNIPKGDYNNQKTILNKVISSTEDSTYLAYTSPLENMLKFTNNIATETEGSILANGSEKEKKIGSRIDWTDYQGFTMMGVSASFETILNSYDTINGHYGLQFRFQMDGNNTIIYYLGIDDMNGNPYHFNTPIAQQKLIDISQLKSIQSLSIYLYQESDFIDGDGELIPSYTPGDNIINTSDIAFTDNILLSDLSIVLGYELGSFSGGSVSLLISKVDDDNNFNTSYGYSALGAVKLKRRLKLRWIHQIDETTYHIIDPEEDKDNVRIKWLHYEIGASGDATVNEYGGPNWAEMKSNSADFTYDITLSVNKSTEEYKVLCSYYENNTWSQWYASDKITFVNTANTADLTTINAISGLSIKCLDNSAGNYYLYSTGGELINEGLGQGYTRTAAVLYNGVNISDSSCELYDTITKIKWSIPNRQTMIEWIKPADGKGDITVAGSSDDYVVWTVEGHDNVLEYGTSLNYSIKNVWMQTNSLNEISCEVTASNNITYKASWIFFFGVNGSSGSNYTVIVEYQNGSGSIPFTAGQTIEETTLVATVYDKNNNQISSEGGTIKWKKVGNDTELHEGDTYTISSSLINEEALKSNFQVISATYKKDLVEATGYLPLSYREMNKCDCYDGPRKIMYNSLGTPTYNSNVCQLRKNNNVVEKVNWTLVAPSKTDNPMLTLKDGAISASNVYQASQNPCYCLYATTENNELLWSQALFILQTAYDFAITNNWNGTLSLDESDSSVMATMIGAGKKENDKFSGVIMGELGTTDNSKVGLYGISKGVVTYSLTDDGVAQFKSTGNSTGEVQLGGTTNTIKSGDEVVTAGSGLLIDIDEGTIQLGSQQGKIAGGALQEISENKFLFSNGKVTVNLNDDGLKLSSTEGLTINNSSIIIGAATIKADGSISVGNTTIKADGSIMYNDQSLEDYIKSIIDKEDNTTD